MDSSHSPLSPNPGGTYAGIKATTDHGTVISFPAIEYGTYSSAFGESLRAPHPSTLIDATETTSHPAQGHDGSLQLSVTMPADAHLNEDLPVVAFIHGGGYESGRRDEPWFSGIQLATERVIMVSISYRLRLAGFAAFSNEDPNHYRGIDDCQVALEWIQRNIEDFGGDPTNVTLAGQSAGAGIALWLARRDHYRGAFRRVWAMSPGFPRSSFAKRKGVLRSVLSKPVTRTSFERIRSGKLESGYRRFRRLYPTDIGIGPAPFDADELAPLPIVISCTGQEFYEDGTVKRAEKRKPFHGFMRRHLGASRRYILNKERPIGQLLTDSMFTRAVVETAENTSGDVWVLRYQGTTSQPALHCCDIPWVLGSYQEVKGSKREFAPFVPANVPGAMHQRFLAFVHGQDPDWPAYARAVQNVLNPRKEIGRTRNSLEVFISGPRAGEEEVLEDTFRNVREGFGIA